MRRCPFYRSLRSPVPNSIINFSRKHQMLNVNSRTTRPAFLRAARVPTSPQSHPSKCDSSLASLEQYAGSCRCAKSFVAVNQARLGEVEWICIWIQVLQWKGDRARKVTFQPFGPATDIDELQRRAGLKSSDNLLASQD